MRAGLRIATSALLACVACGAPPVEPDAAPPRDAGSDAPPDAYVVLDARVVCTSADECDDGVFCNGPERCAPGAEGADEQGCAPALAPPCDGVDRTCHEPAAACLTRCDRTADADGDGSLAMECGGDDCDDGDASRSPGHTEVCDPLGFDEDCDPTTMGDRDLDGDGYVDAACCNGPFCGTDCDDTDALRHPGAIERCDMVDEDCDGSVDEDLRGEFFLDADGDGFGAGEAVVACAAPAGHVLRAGDCDDSDPSRHPAASEICNGQDEDCSGIADDATASVLCPPDATCMDGACVFPVGCPPGAFDCDGDPATACDTDVRASQLHCGACGHACAAHHTCVEALCKLRTRAVSVGLGWTHSCAVTSGAAVACWGDNARGQVGDGTRAVRLRPVLISSLAGVEEVSAGRDTSCALAAAAVWCWGSDVQGQLGDGMPDSTGSTVPTQVMGLSDAVDVSVGGYHVCAVRATGAVACWGSGTRGQLGHGSTTSSAVPVTVTGLTDAVAVSAAELFTCALRSTGQVVCWGENLNGELGNGTTTASNVPVDVMGITNAVDVSTGNDHACAAHADGPVSCWGANDDGQLGQGGTTLTPSTSLVPLEVPGITTATRVVAGGEHTCAVEAGGRLSCWGRDREGQVGDGDPPVLVGGRPVITAPAEVFADGVTDVSLGLDHSCAVRGSTVHCWGTNTSGQLGDGGYDGSVSPVPLVELAP